MSTYQDIFEFLAPFQISDHLLEKSYDNVGDTNRALLKQAIAFHFSVQRFIQPHHDEIKQYFTHSSSGLHFGIHKKNTPFLFCVFDNSSFYDDIESRSMKNNAIKNNLIEDNKAVRNLAKNTLPPLTSPAQLLSILCPALIARVPNIIVWFYTRPSDAILTSLELCGIENIYIYDENQSKNLEDFYHITKECLKALKTPCENNQNSHDFYGEKEIENNVNKSKTCFEKGRLILFANTQKEKSKKFAHTLFKKARCQNIITYHDDREFYIYANSSQKKDLHFAFPLAHIFLSENTPIHEEDLAGNKEITLNQDIAKNNTYDISYCHTKTAEQNYHEGMELCYIHPHVNVDFFMNSIYTAHKHTYAH